jgi:hypothetical protein
MYYDNMPPFASLYYTIILSSIQICAKPCRSLADMLLEVGMIRGHHLRLCLYLMSVRTQGTAGSRAAQIVATADDEIRMYGRQLGAMQPTWSV